MQDLFDDTEKGCMVVIWAIIGIIALLFVGPLITMWLWNWIAVDLFAAPVIGYWQAFGLEWLCNILFKPTITTSWFNKD
jgi:hypothetical protein